MKTGLVDERRNGGAHTSRTILLSELTAVLAVVSPDAPQDTYRTAVIEDNVLGKKTLNSRQRSFRYLRELYALDPETLLFRALRDLWESCPTDQPLLAMLCALARDPSLRATAAAVLPLSQGEAVTADDLARALMNRYPGIYIDAVANKVGRNAASSWTQSGHLIGRTGKTRIRAACGPAAVAYALFLGRLGGAVGEGLFTTFWAQVLDVPRTVVLEQAMTASQRGWIELRHGGGVTDITFRLLLRDDPGRPQA